MFHEEVPEGRGRCAGVLVIHGGGGPSEHERDKARALATLGYVAMAPDLFGERFTDRAHGARVIGALVADAARIRERVIAAWRSLCAHPRVDPDRTAAIGHCFGGLAALELARSGAAIRAAIAFHGGLTTAAPARPGDVKASVLACSGAADPYITREQRAGFEDEMTAAGVDWQHHLYAGARHGFTIAGADFDALAERRSWRAAIALLADVLEPRQ
jgi:dienelactone hydrolase